MYPLIPSLLALFVPEAVEILLSEESCFLELSFYNSNYYNTNYSHMNTFTCFLNCVTLLYNLHITSTDLPRGSSHQF